MANNSFLINQDSGEKTWLTPKWILDSLGHFDTDPCTPEGMPWKTADRMYTKKDDGTTAPWVGRVWLNPPYGKEAWPFLERMAHYEGGVSPLFSSERTRGNGTNGCSLMPTRSCLCEGGSTFVPRMGRREVSPLLSGRRSLPTRRRMPICFSSPV